MRNTLRDVVNDELMATENKIATDLSPAPASQGPR